MPGRSSRCQPHLLDRELILMYHISRQRQLSYLICGLTGRFAGTCRALEDKRKTQNCLTIVENARTAAKATGQESGRTTGGETGNERGAARYDDLEPTRTVKNESAGNKEKQAPEDQGEDAWRHGRVVISSEAEKWTKSLLKTRKKVKAAMQQAANDADDLNPHTNILMGGAEYGSLEELHEKHGPRCAATPANENCQYYALAEAALQRKIKDNTTQSIDMTSAIKAAIQAVGSVHFEPRFQRRSEDRSF
ncbi:hypothetical protein PybrP1_001960 [[Pythium] brassicae (nom. inval.)]|nr:hypothetical protein PybrP1_001960 [[Pythium] brassicae (nom. inval.)]